MIKTISIQGYKSFPHDWPVVITFDTSKRVAMLYGVNGAGKSAIGQVIHRNGNNIEPVAHCSIALTRDEPYQYLVYNDDFVEQTFRNRSDMPGIFTIGRPEAAALKRAEELEKGLEAWRDRQEVLAALRAEREAEKTRAHNAVLDGVWPAYADHKNGALKEWVSGLGKRKRHAGRRLAYDHRHRHVSDKGVPYEFTSPQQLLEDFFSEVDRVLEETKS